MVAKGRNQKKIAAALQGRFRLCHEESPCDGVRRVARGQLDSAIELLERRNGGDLDEAIHEARKTLKRLRALLRLSRDELGARTYQRENTTLRDVGRGLSDARDAQVLVETLDALTTRFEAELPDGAFARFRKTLIAEAEAAREGRGDGTSMSEPAETLSQVRMRVATWPLPEHGGPESLAPGLERVYRRGRRALDAAEDHADSEDLHELRKRAKDLWHSAQLLEETAPEQMKTMAREGHRLSDLLGDDHDLLVLRERADSSPELFKPRELELLHALIERRRGALQRQALSCASTVYSRKPRKLRSLVAS